MAEYKSAPQRYCYRVKLPQTYPGSRKSHCGVTVDADGIVYMIALDIAEVGQRFPDAILIEKVGVAVS